MKKAFTLIELLIVVALIAIVSTLAVTKIGGVREGAARKISLANQKAVERAVDAFLANGGRLNRLDSLFYAGEGGAPYIGSAVGFDFSVRDGFYYGPKEDCGADVRAQYNQGLTPGLTNVLCRYTLSSKEVASLTTRLGLKYVMAHTAYADAAQNAYPSIHYPKDRAYGDGTVPNAADGLDANDSACIATLVTNQMVVAAVNPMSDLGRTIYQACGQELMNTIGWGESYDEEAVKTEVAQKGGPLLAFGLGSSASIIGKADGGIEDAPYATFAQKQFYSRYILLIRLKTIGSGSASVTLPEFAGVIDCCGSSVRQAEHIIKRM